jgi:Ca2+-transporting ATPase
VVVATGSKTQFGQIAKSLEDSEEETTPLQKKLDEFGELLGYRALTDSHLFFCAPMAARRPTG